MRFVAFLLCLVVVLAGCGQKGSLYLPHDYEFPTYRKDINRSLDAVEDIVTQALQSEAQANAEGEDTDASVDLDPGIGYPDIDTEARNNGGRGQ